MNHLPEQEEQIMKIIWEVGESNIKTFLDKMPKPKLPYTTLASIIRNLEKKGYLKSRLIAHVYLYSPAISEKEYKRRFMNSFIEKYFSRSYKDLVAFFIQQKKISAKDLKELINIIEKRSIK